MPDETKPDYGDEEKCSASQSGKHEPYPPGATLFINGESTRVIVDVPCKHCGRSGSVSVDIDACEVNW